MEELNEYTYILASASPRRKKLLEDLGLRCRVFRNLNADESFPSTLELREVAIFIARNKSLAYPEKLGEKEILITADTVVCRDHTLLNKPATEAEARKMLKNLSGCSHFVHTGVFLRTATIEKGFTSSTEVWFDSLSDVEIDYYIHHFQPFDKAGAYGIQEWIGLIGIERIDGSFYNVMGLPVHRLYKELLGLIHRK